MYIVNAERSQEKNDRNGRMQCRTKVTCATRARKKVPVTSQVTLWLSFRFVVSSAHTVRAKSACDEGMFAHREPSRSFPRSIMRNDFAATNRLKERAYGRIE